MSSAGYDFSPLKTELSVDVKERPSLSYWKDAWMRMKKNRIAVFSFVFILLIILIAAVGPVFYPVDPFEQNVQESSQPPNLGFQAMVIKRSTWSVPTRKKTSQETELRGTPVIGGFSVQGYATTLGVRLFWEEVKGAGGYHLYRSEQRPKNIDQLGFPVAYLDGDEQLGYEDKKRVQAKTYYYSLVPTDGLRELEIFKTIEVTVQRAVYAEKARKIDPTLKEGDLLKIKAKPLGTDSLGRDLLARILHGARVSLFIGFAAPLLFLCIGIFYGGLSGLIGRNVDLWLMRVADFIDGIPYVLFIILFRIVVGVEAGESGIQTMLIAMVVILWPSTARMVRTQIMHLKEQGFVQASRIMGVHPFYLLFRHLLPNTLGVILVKFSFEIPAAILLEAFFSFIGLGVAPPTPSWGSLSYEGMQSIRSHPHEIIVPSVAISLTVLAFNLFGDGLRDALDPKLRNEGK